MRLEPVAQPAASHAKDLLHRASRRLQTADPVEQMGGLLEDSMPRPVGDPAYRGSRLLEPGFRENQSDSLSFVMTTGGPGASPVDRQESALEAMDHLVGRNFGGEARRWLHARVDPLRGRRRMSWGGCLGSGFDRHGLRDTEVTVEWGPGLMDALPGMHYKIAQAALETLPGLRPALSTIRAGRSSGSQQLIFDLDAALGLADLKPLMARLGLGAQHPSLMSAVALILGARFTLPPGSAVLALKPTRRGVELRLDIDLGLIPDLPAQLVSLLRLQMAERPRSLRALDRWLMALTPDGYQQPGSPTVLSVRTRPDMPARLSLFFRPTALEAPEDGSIDLPGEAPAGAPVAAGLGAY